VQIDTHILDSLAASRSRFRARLIEQTKSLAKPAPTVPSRPQCRLKGSLLFGSRPPIGWKCTFLRRGSAGGNDVRLNSRGGFELAVPRPGRYWISFLHSNHVTDSSSEISGTVDLTMGANAWSLDVPVGSVTIENLERLPPVEDVSSGPGAGPRIGYRVLCKIRGGMEWTAEKWVGSGATWELPVVPTGSVTLSRLGPHPSPRPSNWTESITVELRPGESRRISLP